MLGPDDQDVLWFAGRPWQALSRADWDAHAGALYAFAPSAFRYFLPSVLTLALEQPDPWFSAFDGLLIVLDRSPTPAYWGEFILTRLLGLQDAEYAVLERLLLALAESARGVDQDQLGRAFDTVVLLQEATARGAR